MSGKEIPGKKEGQSNPDVEAFRGSLLAELDLIAAGLEESAERRTDPIRGIAGAVVDLTSESAGLAMVRRISTLVSSLQSGDMRAKEISDPAVQSEQDPNLPTNVILFPRRTF